MCTNDAMESPELAELSHRWDPFNGGSPWESETLGTRGRSRKEADKKNTMQGGAFQKKGCVLK